MPRLFLFFIALLALPLLGFDSPPEYDGKIEANGIEGEWRITKVIAGGKEIQPPFQSVVSFRGGAFVRNDSDGDWWKGTYTTNLSRNPSSLDITEKQVRGVGFPPLNIFQVEGDLLRIANTNRL